MPAAASQLKEARTATEHEAVLVQAWARRRPPWTRTDTARWLNDRSEQVLAWLRRRRPRAPQHSRQMGYWVKENEPHVFSRVHEQLAACATNNDRERLLTSEVLK